MQFNIRLKTVYYDLVKYFNLVLLIIAKKIIEKNIEGSDKKISDNSKFI